MIDPDDPAFLAAGRHAGPDRGGRADAAADQPAAGVAAGARPLHPRQPRRRVRRGPSRDAARLSGRRVEVVHLVGGGAATTLLCQLTADACGLPVVAGPVEATALGNVLVQARAHGLLAGDLETLRGAGPGDPGRPPLRAARADGPARA